MHSLVRQRRLPLARFALYLLVTSTPFWWSDTIDRRRRRPKLDSDPLLLLRLLPSNALALSKFLLRRGDVLGFLLPTMESSDMLNVLLIS